MRGSLVLAACIVLGVGCGDTSTEEDTPRPRPDTGGEQQPGMTGILDERAFAALHQLTAEHAPAARGQTIEVGGARAYLSLPEGARAPLPAILVVHEWWGLNEHIQHWTDRLAQAGYAALAIDLYDGQIATEPARAMELMRAVDDARATEIVRAAHAFLHDDPRIAADRRGVLGWCFGGGWALRAAIELPDLDAAVMYYGRPVTDVAELRRIRAPLLGIFGNRDQAFPPAMVDDFERALGEAGTRHRILRYDADHGFANPSGARYDATHAAAAWREARSFLDQHLRATHAP